MTSPHGSHYALRRDLRTALRQDLLGPFDGPDEVLVSDAPVTAYPIGVLFPQSADGRERTAETDETVDAPPDVVSRDDSEQGTADLGVSFANQRKPSSIGLTFAIDTRLASTLLASVRGAVYVPEDENGHPIEPRRSEARTVGQQRERWRRSPIEFENLAIDVTAAGVQQPRLIHPGLELRVLVRPAHNEIATITVTLVNVLRANEFDLQDAYCFFQPEVLVSGLPGTEPFVDRASDLDAVDDDEALSRLIHRHAPRFATGHGCSVHWAWEAPAIHTAIPTRPTVSAVRTEFIPTHEVLLTDSNPDIDDEALGMVRLGHSERATVVEGLRHLLDSYDEWIIAKTSELSELAGSVHAPAAEQQVRLCRAAHARMGRGVRLLADERQPEIFEAFRLANQAMAQQRGRTAWIKNGRSGTPDLDSARWRPFQIAFVLLCLEGIVDSSHDDRDIADLLWFPTGGGKTEAYLGLIAFTVFLRRLRDKVNGAGVTVLMRYTLRLLTLQQFERAAALICAMESLRARHHARLGEKPISIGMWVGASATPNRLERAEERLAELANNPGKSLTKENPVQLQACPWCGAPLQPQDYEVRLDSRRMLVRCPGADCEFRNGSGLPVHLVDEAVYDAHPTLVVATVDKFASMPWRPETGALFNRDLADIVRPPELIVQDELHLISGPLGTLTGLYETAIDILADRPKVIASTATIRRASHQVKGLFDRKVAQFPPAGLDSRDSWFAVETARADKASRRYIGLLTPSTSQATLLVRTYANLLDAVANADTPASVTDAYWTLVGYFNSLRLLSAAELQVRDDVQDRLEMLAARRDLARPREASSLVELSSRANSSDIPRHLKQLDLALPHRDTLDVLLATNMISVGVDIDRLGLMAIMGQPQTTAEYIQASSRVGRRHPGLIAVMLNSTRSRDRSHYENFPAFHSALYRDVESTSVTPFSTRARDRGLHAVIVALTRLMIPAASANSSAAHIEEFADEVNSIVRPRFLARVEAIDPGELETTTEEFDNFLASWRLTAQEHPDLVFESPRLGRRAALLSSFDGTDDVHDDGAGWSTLWSLRDVDAESALFLEHNRQERS
ncbi:helicase-related protein [Kribbella sp. NPDC049227]|uniref:helicase-related protein n=1 Tax=Kribbella sp. NPDC049227 TaxID=3364113 RepID=UPI003718F09E